MRRALLLAAASVAFAGVARADLISPEEEAARTAIPILIGLAVVAGIVVVAIALTRGKSKDAE